MPYETIWEQKGAYQRFRGKLTRQDKEHANNEIMGDQRFDGMAYWIVDSLAIEEYLPEMEDAVRSAAYDLGAEYYNDHLLMVFVATNTDHRNNILRYMKFLEDSGSTWKTGLFDNLESAKNWISETL